MKKHVFAKNLYKWVKHRFTMTSLSGKDSLGMETLSGKQSLSTVVTKEAILLLSNQKFDGRPLFKFEGLFDLWPFLFASKQLFFARLNNFCYKTIQLTFIEKNFAFPLTKKFSLFTELTPGISK